MRIKHSVRAEQFLRRLRERDTAEYRFLNGLIILLSTDPSVDNKTKTYMDFGSGTETPVYVDADWWIVYRTDNQGDEETLIIVSIWDATRPPHTRL